MSNEVMEQTMYYGSLPVRERGLKSDAFAMLAEFARSLPVRERGLKSLKAFPQRRFRTSLPVRERGLKFRA